MPVPQEESPLFPIVRPRGWRRCAPAVASILALAALAGCGGGSSDNSSGSGGGSTNAAPAGADPAVVAKLPAAIK